MDPRISHRCCQVLSRGEETLVSPNPNYQKMMRQVQKMQADMAKMQDDLSS